ncbi:MAG: glycoside hydrolase family 9 protein [Cytophagales bacterium]|nr:glycoside hydrolase family 9 protein [Cytophagales bacterium]
MSARLCFSCLLFFASFAASAQYNYAEGLQKALFFYEAQRSGKMPPGNRVHWRGDSHLQDGRDAGIDLTGGWYDAGDTPKWNVTMSFAASTLAWSAVAYPEAYRRTGQTPHLLGSLKWVGDYFIKCVRFKTVDDLASYRVFVEVGNSEEEHKSWAANEVMHLLQPKRPSFYADKDAPATSVVAGMAASQALSSIVFRQNGNARYADALLLNARKLYEFASKYQGNGQVKNAKGETVKHSDFFDGDKFQDQLCWAALWLHEAAKTTDAKAAAQYLEQAERLAASFAGRLNEAVYWYSGYELACYVRLSQLLPDNKLYRQRTEAALDRVEKTPRTPGGLAKLGYEWGSLRHVNNAAWLFFVYADGQPNGQDKEKYLAWAKSQLDYSLGGNPQNRSYLIGFQPPGKTVVNTPHHRTAYAPWAGWEHLNPEKPEYRQAARHTLYGGLVGGPDWKDAYKADASKAEQTEVALDFNAGITANLARMTAKTDTKPLANFPTAEKPDDEFFVEAAVDDTDDNAVEIKARLNNRSAWPARVTRNLAFRYYFQPEPGTRVTAKLLHGDGAVVSQPQPAAGGMQYVTVSFPNTPIFPGGLDPNNDWRPFYRREAVFRLESSGAWDNRNDWSFAGVAPEGKEPAKARRISVWEGKTRLAGQEPK